MVKIIVELDEKKYQQISDTVNMINQRNKLLKKEDRYTIEHFIIGSTMDKLDLLDNIVSNQQHNIDEKVQLLNSFKQIAQEKGIKQVDICKKLGISKGLLSQIFSNKVNMSMETFFKIWIALECPPIQSCFTFKEK